MTNHTNHDHPNTPAARAACRRRAILARTTLRTAIADLKVRRHRTHGRYVEVRVENLIPGMPLDMGVYAERREAMFDGAVNPHTWEIVFTDGMRYTETRGAMVRVWIDEIR